jgi:alpha-L-rhamnosidase
MLLLFVLGFFAKSLSLSVTDLRVNYLADPVGVATTPRFSWVLVHQKDFSLRGLQQASYNVKVYTASGSQVWDSGVVRILVNTLLPFQVKSSENHLVHYAGSTLTSSTSYRWNVRVVDSTGRAVVSTNATFITGLLSSKDWSANWITGGNSANQLRKEFVLPWGKNSFFCRLTEQGQPISLATVHVSGLGYFELRCNGKKVGDHSLDVGWTDYGKRAYYVSFDLTPYLLGPGSTNALAVTLGNGWFSCLGQQPGCRSIPPQLLLQVVVSSGSSAHTIISDTTWKASPGPIVYDSLYNGETYDATKEMPGWDLPNYDDRSWISASAATFVPPIVTAQTFEPIRKISETKPVTISEPQDGIYVVDFGQNMAGVIRLRLRNCFSGTQVVLRHAELLNHPPYGPVDGLIYTGNLRSAKATDTYTCKGDPSGEETYEPTFTQHGFRFCQITGLPQILEEDDIVAVEMHSDVEEAGEVATNVDLINKIQHNVVWGQKSNLMSVPTGKSFPLSSCVPRFFFLDPPCQLRPPIL